MGGGFWDYTASERRTRARVSAPRQTVFAQTDVHGSMSIHGLTVRESRDSTEHPNSRAIAFIVDSTGSMGDIPHSLATKTLPTFMRLVLPFEPDAQILFGAVQDFQDNNADRSCQIGQFESNDALADQWLTRICIGGGGRPSEGYEVGLFVASRFFKMDCLEKRGQEGYLFFTGDDTVRPEVRVHDINTLLGRKELKGDMAFRELVLEAREKFHLFFLIPDPQRVGYDGVGTNVLDCWRGYLGENVIVQGHHNDTALVSALLIGLTEGEVRDLDAARDLMESLGIDVAQKARVIRAIAPYASHLESARALHAT